MRRQRSLRVVQRDVGLLPRIQTLKAEPPFWGDRRMWAYLRVIEPWPINQKRVLRLMREHQLLVPPHLRLKARRTPTAGKPTPTRPNEWGSIDMTKVLVSGCGWVDVVIDWYTTKIVGYHAGLRCTAMHWLEALDMAVNGQFPNGARGQSLSLMCDGCQPTAIAFLEACNTLEIGSVSA